ncbi:MAG: hypothetical protein EOP62_09075 [Sphingomonadales bacterium]|nr:MAG: hypothetical protein EOP62_09075 [Sphingomonadales bacterium]
MKARIAAFCLALIACAPAMAQERSAFRTSYVPLASRDSEALLYEPVEPNPKTRIALVYSHPNGNTFTEPLGPQMSARGYRVLMVNFHGTNEADDAYAPGISLAIGYLRKLPGVDRVIIVGHSGGGHLAAFYQSVAERGPDSCSGPEKIYPCRRQLVTGLAKADGIVLLDPTLGAAHQMHSIDPAVTDTGRAAALDMFTAANGYDLANKSASYSPAFQKRFHAAQAARNARLVDQALTRLHAIEQGKGQFSDDEPFVIPGIGVTSTGARLYQPDISLLSRTRGRHLLLRADGTEAEQIVHSVRPPSGQQAVSGLRSMEVMAKNTTVRRFLAATAIRTTPDYAITADNITGMDWASAFTSTPGAAQGITVPALVLSMSCHYLLVPDEIIFEHLGSRDKSFAAVEGATHVFNPCKPEYGDTVKRTFDFIDRWLAKEGRF